MGDAHSVPDGAAGKDPESRQLAFLRLATQTFHAEWLLGGSAPEGRTDEALPGIWRGLIVTERSVCVRL